MSSYLFFESQISSKLIKILVRQEITGIRSAKLKQFHFIYTTFHKFCHKLCQKFTERQIGESVWINNYLRDGVVMMNSRNEYNRCIIPRLKIDLDKDEELIEYEESEKEIKREIHRMKEELRYEKQQQKSKKIKLDKKVKKDKIVKNNKMAKNELRIKN